MAYASAVEVVREFWRLMGTNDFSSVGKVLGSDFVLEWPQSKERIRGAEKFAQMNREYPANGPWRFSIDRLFGSESEVVTQVSITDGVQQATALSLFTVDAGRISRLTEFWPEPYAAPTSRAHLVEPME